MGMIYSESGGICRRGTVLTGWRSAWIRVPRHLKRVGLVDFTFCIDMERDILRLFVSPLYFVLLFFSGIVSIDGELQYRMEDLRILLEDCMMLLLSGPLRESLNF